MNNSNNNQKEKLPRAVVMANNKKQKQIQNILSLRDEMIKNSIDSTLIKKFIDEEYDKINKEYELKIKKNKEKTKKSSGDNDYNKNVKELKKKRDKAIEFLLKNKSFLEEHGASKEYVKKYVDKQYQEINEYYVGTNLKSNKSESDIDNEQADFID